MTDSTMFFILKKESNLERNDLSEEEQKNRKEMKL
jgi:hypothetical protein